MISPNQGGLLEFQERQVFPKDLNFKGLNEHVQLFYIIRFACPFLIFFKYQPYSLSRY